LKIKNTDIKVNVDFDIDKGYLKPNFYDVTVNLGDSMLEHDNWFA
jgi:hypothetical protein